MTNKRDLELLFEIGSLRHIQRGWRQHLATNCANDLEHTVRVAFLALIIARREGIKNEEKADTERFSKDLREVQKSISWVWGIDKN